MKLYIVRKSKIVWNVFLFIFFSYFYFYVVDCLFKGLAPLLEKSIINFVKNHLIISILWPLSLVLIHKIKKTSKLCILAWVIIAYVDQSTFLFANFDKLVFLSLVLYLIYFFIFYNMWVRELASSIYGPNLKIEDLKHRPRLKINVKVTYDKGYSTNGILTNWDEKGCFIFINNVIPINISLVDVEISFKGATFANQGSIVTYLKGHKGIGVSFIPQDEKLHHPNWQEFYNILVDYGYYPHRVV